MKRINELKQERSDLIKDMESVLNKVADEKRAQSEDEKNAWNEKNQKVEQIDNEIKTLERQEQLNLSIVTNSHKDNIETVNKRYDFGKAITEAKSGNLTGVEAEMHQEAERELKGVNGVRGNLYLPSAMFRANEATKTTGAADGHIPTLNTNLDVVVPNPLYRELGVTVYENLSAGKLVIPFSQGHTAGRVDEEAGATQSVPTKTKGDLTASRFQGWQQYTQEYLAESTVFPQILADMTSSIDRAIGEDLIGAAGLANVMTDFAHTDDAAFIDYLGVLDLMAELDNDSFIKEGFVMSKELFYYLVNEPKSVIDNDWGSGDIITTTSGGSIIDFAGKNKGNIAGVDAFGTGFLPEHDTNRLDLIYGDWSKAYVGFWGGIQLLIDPYTGSDTGEIKVTFSRMADTAVNPYAFASKRNTKIA